MQIRRYKPGEERAIRDVYYGSTRNVVATRYTHEQVKRWAPDTYDHVKWVDRLARSKPFVAVQNEQIVGFAEVLDSGEINGVYCHHNFQRRGVGSALMRAVVEHAERVGASHITARVSLTAVDFFLSQGFEIIAETNNIVCGSPARQFEMKKSLSSTSDSRPDEPSLSLIVLRVTDIEIAAAFYTGIGLTFQREQHGNGPEHFSATLGSIVMELYPASDRFPVSTSRLGFSVSSIEAVMNSLRRFDCKVISEPKQSEWGLRAVIADPDGHRIELTQR